MFFDHPITLSALFIAAPLAVMPLLDKNARMDMVDLYEANITATVGNRYGGISELTMLSDTLIAVNLTESSTMEIRLTADSLIEVKHNVAAKKVNTKVRYYDLNWSEIKN